MRIKIKDWRLALLAFLFICLFTCLGFWQLSRANQKKVLLKSFADRTLHASLTVNHLTQMNDLRFYRAALTGHFDNQHTFLLDNKISHGQVGYEVYTPFIAQGLSTPILVDRGFIPLGKSRSNLPAIKPILGNTEINGMLNFPPAYVAYGPINESSNINWPLRIEFVNMQALDPFLNYKLFSYVLTLNKKMKGAYDIEWQAVTMGPERHIGYALQWFAFALTLLILFVALNRDRSQG